MRSPRDTRIFDDAVLEVRLRLAAHDQQVAVIEVDADDCAGAPLCARRSNARVAPNVSEAMTG